MASGDQSTTSCYQAACDTILDVSAEQYGFPVASMVAAGSYAAGRPHSSGSAMEGVDRDRAATGPVFSSPAPIEAGFLCDYSPRLSSLLWPTDSVVDVSAPTHGGRALSAQCVLQVQPSSGDSRFALTHGERMSSEQFILRGQLENSGNGTITMQGERVIPASHLLHGMPLLFSGLYLKVLD